MRRLIRGREIVADTWRYDGEAGDGPRVVPLEALPEAAAAAPAAQPLGVSLQPTDDPEGLAPWLPRLGLVVIDFPKVGEGRGFSLAQLVRQRHGYRGELRARGALKRDQLFFLARCGFDSYDLDPAENLEPAVAAFDTFSVAYQPGSGLAPAQRTR
jgi:uncharacterized protein (DUF934 family)